MTEIMLLIMGCLLILLFFVWFIFGNKITSKAVMLLLDIGLLALCIAVIICGLMLRQEKYKNEAENQAQASALANPCNCAYRQEAFL